MPRLILIAVFVLWMLGAGMAQPEHLAFRALAIFLGGYVAVVGLLAVWARRAAQRTAVIAPERGLLRYGRVLNACAVMMGKKTRGSH